MADQRATGVDLAGEVAVDVWLIPSRVVVAPTFLPGRDGTAWARWPQGRTPGQRGHPARNEETTIENRC